MYAENTLEFDALRDLIARYVRSALGQAELETLAPGNDRAHIENALAEVDEGMRYLRAAAQAPGSSSQHGSSSHASGSHGSAQAGRGVPVRLNFGQLSDPGPAVMRLRIDGAVLDGRELYELMRLLEVASEARTILSGADKYPKLSAHAANIADLRDISRELSGKVLPDGSLSDDASVALGRLRRDMERQRGAIQSSLEKFMKAHHADGTLQEQFVTIRNDRFVVPVVTGRERRVDGVIHGSSGSGATVFVEPLETIALNNELVRLTEEELREIHRILREFTGRLRQHAVEILATTRALATLEFIFAKAEFGLDFECVVPRLSPEHNRRLIIRDARHPLLQDILRKRRKSVIPISFELDEQQRTLLISGPNTGGKTVTLKTAGLLALMAHAGLPVPATAAEFPLFQEILADIGDHQSLAESLSTFSAHIVGVKTMLEEATRDSLVLIDELGRATDPEEGGALGVSVLEAFRNRGAFTLSSTHLMALKVYGASTPGVQNGSMGFDEATLEPTYILRLGAPGKSAGLDIASRLGLSAGLIEQARGRLSNSERDIARFIAEMNDRLAALDRERRTVEERERKLAERERTIEQSWQKKYAEKVQELEDRAAQLSKEFEHRAQSTIGELSQKALVKIARTKREFRESMEAVVESGTQAIAPRAAGVPAKPKLQEGVRVRLKGIRQPASIRRILSNGLLEVDAGFLKMQVAESDVEEVLPPIDAPMRRVDVSFNQGPAFSTPYREINLIGQRAEEACDQVDKMLDSAALAQVDRIRIVHGHGMGILKKAVANLLLKHPHVQKFYQASQEEGGSGATIVELKE
jgi:DNA mismatch repair protein MutS2